MWPNLRHDFDRVYTHIGYRGGLRKTLHALTNPGFQAVWSYRFRRWLMRCHVPLIGEILERFTEVWTGISIPAETQIGPGLMILHSGGVVINGRVVLGSGCTLHHNVTIGNRVSGGPSPHIGDRVMIGVGACVLGGIELGDDVEIGANAVVIDSVPHGGIAVGVPAKIVRVKSDAALRASLR